MQHILTINAGSSSIKFALFELNETFKRRLAGQIEHIGSPDAVIKLTDQASGQTEQHPVKEDDHGGYTRLLIETITRHVSADEIVAVGHRIVHGGARFSDPHEITADVIAELEKLSPFDPEHLPAEIAMIKALSEAYPRLRQVACFDTAFHRAMPSVAKILPIPRRYFNQGIQRYGFHGISYAFLMGELRRLDGDAAANGRVVLAHLGNGASIAAVKGGQSIDTSMAFTPTAGLVMSSRSGDLDPGLSAYLARAENMSPDRFYQLANFESGLLGVSEITSDMRELLKREHDDSRAADAVALFCYTARKFIGAYAAALGGLNTLVFAGGIGENAPVIRARMCEGLAFLGIALDEQRNTANAPQISSDSGGVKVRVMKTDEELQIAHYVRRLMNGSND